MNRNLLLLLLLLLALPVMADDDELHKKIPFQKMEVPIYQVAPFTPQVVLRTNYAEAVLENGENWLAKARTNFAYEIDLVFTLYPREIQDWRTNYFELLEERLQSLVALDSNLRHPRIRWNMILQTQPANEEEAKEMFHGFVIKYRPKRVRMLDDVKTPAQFKAIIAGKAGFRDSTVYKVLDRHPEWDSMLVVADWTGSMYKHGAQLVLWYKESMLNYPDRVKHFVFFNDGNHKKGWQKKVGRTGGVYRARSSEVPEVIETMEYVMKKGNGGDPPENDLEALLTGLQYLDDFQEVILIADNKSEVRDIELLTKIDRPVHIILCDIRGKIHPHYYQIARETGGSIHTLRKDLEPKADP
ncbi:MAG: hypothetical protein AAF399_28845 [Bacteroidota bacterium]